MATVQAETDESFTFPLVIFAKHWDAEVQKGNAVSICLLNSAIYALRTNGIRELGDVVSTVNAVAAPSILWPTTSKEMVARL